MVNTQHSQTFEYIDLIRRKIDAAGNEPKFSQEISERARRTPNSLRNDRETLRTFAELIAYSQNAQARLVSNLLSTDVFETVFDNFEVEQVCILKPAIIEAKYWKVVSAIRFKKKIAAIIGCAKSLRSIETEYGSFIELLERTRIPLILRSESDIERFWQGFNDLLHTMNRVEMPFFGRVTSLLHFLLTVGYDCVKPDMIVMKVAKMGNMVTSETGDKNLRKVVRDIQLYSVARQIRPSVVDLYFLIYGGQTGVKYLVDPSFWT
ncbi:MAG: DNA-3-methyladenine glycosylase I [Chloroflexi bacterium]|nr:DNA-3-methyladenine glycosylase I [Chloroflexota bacterium]